MRTRFDDNPVDRGKRRERKGLDRFRERNYAPCAAFVRGREQAFTYTDDAARVR